MSMHDLRAPPGRTYRYYPTPLFEFGSGLSLTDFSVTGTAPACLSSLTTSAPHAVCAVSLTVENRGGMDGDAVVLAYFRSTRTQAEWAAKRRAQGLHERLGEARAKALLTPRKQLFDYARLKGVKKGSSTTLTFNVTAASIAEVDEKTGDLVSEAGSYELLFDDGSGGKIGLVSMAVAVKGANVVLEPFPSEV